MTVSGRAPTPLLDAIVLAGGEGRRMGSPKAVMPLGQTTLVGTVVSILRPLFRRVLVVTRDTAGLARLDVQVLTDDRPEQGPLVGLAKGLAASDAPWCFVVGCDMPFLRPEVILRMADNLHGCDALTTRLQGYLEPLHAFYGRPCLALATALLDGGVTSLHTLLRRCQVKAMDANDFRDLDPELRSFRDLDTVEEYRAAQQMVQ